jgi:hypothetical protein
MESSMSCSTPPPGRTDVPQLEPPRGSHIEQAINRLRQAFMHLPGVNLSVSDASRLTELEPFLCQILLNALEDLRLVRRCSDGLYERPAE